MARSVFRASLKGDANGVENAIWKIAHRYGFVPITYADESQVWKKAGLNPMVRYLKFEIDSNEVVVSAWLRDSTLDKGHFEGGGLVINAALGVAKRLTKDPEQSLDGFVAMLPKKMFKKDVKKIVSEIERL